MYFYYHFFFISCGFINSGGAIICTNCHNSRGRSFDFVSPSPSSTPRLKPSTPPSSRILDSKFSRSFEIDTASSSRAFYSRNSDTAFARNFDGDPASVSSTPPSTLLLVQAVSNSSEHVSWEFDPPESLEESVPNIWEPDHVTFVMKCFFLQCTT